MKFCTIILAAGKGTRMKSDLPKVLHPLCGKPMIFFPVTAAQKAGSEKTVAVIGHGADAVRENLRGHQLDFAVQEEQLGTGHAVMVCEKHFSGNELPVLILCGDAPLIRAATISDLVESHINAKNSVTVLTADMLEPAGYGRIVKDGTEILKIVEEKDASDKEKSICEINSGVYCVDGGFLFEALKKINKGNAQGEYYLTDIIKTGRDSGRKVGWSKISDGDEIMGINSRKELSTANRIMRERILDGLMEKGVSIDDPASTYVDFGVTIGRESRLYPQVSLEGNATVGENVIIEQGSIIRGSSIGDGSHIRPYCLITKSELNCNTIIGPFAHLRPGTIIQDGAKVGNFVELKKSTLGEGSKANHLTYIGDSDIGKGVNIGAGTITCNYDGYNKFKTVIEDGVFVGSGTNLIAPVKIGKNSIIGAGSTITKEVPADSLSLSRAEQKTMKDWARKKRESQEKS